MEHYVNIDALKCSTSARHVLSNDTTVLMRQLDIREGLKRRMF